MKQKMVIGVLNKTGLSASSLKFQMGIYVIEAALKALLSHYINHKVIKKVSDEEDVSLGMLVAEKKPWLLSMLLPWLSKNSQQCVITEATKYMLLCSQAKMIVQNTSATYSPEQKAEAAKYSKSRKSNVFLASHAFHKFLLFGQKSNFSDQKQEFSNQNQNFVKKNDFFSFVQKQKDLLTAIKTFVENIIQKDLDSKQNIQNNSVQVIPRDEPQRSSDSSVKTDESVENIQKPVENNELILFSVQNNQQNLNEHIVNLHSDTVKAIKDYIESEFKDNLLFLHGMNDIKEYSLDRTNYGKLLETIDNHLQDLDFVSKKIQEYNNIHGNFISTGFIKSLLKAGGYNHPRLDEAQEAEEFFNAVKAVEQEKKELSEIQSNKSDA